MLNDPRIGTIREDKSREWPTLNIEGADYKRPATVFKLDKTHFVVLPVNFETRWPSEKIRAAFPAFGQPVTVGSAKPVEAESITTKKATNGKS